MLAPASLTHFSWSLNFDTFIMVNVLGILAKIFRRDYRLNNCY